MLHFLCFPESRVFPPNVELLFLFLSVLVSPTVSFLLILFLTYFLFSPCRPWTLFSFPFLCLMHPFLVLIGPSFPVWASCFCHLLFHFPSHATPFPHLLSSPILLFFSLLSNLMYFLALSLLESPVSPLICLFSYPIPVPYIISFPAWTSCPHASLSLPECRNTWPRPTNPGLALASVRRVVQRAKTEHGLLYTCFTGRYTPPVQTSVMVRLSGHVSRKH